MNPQESKISILTLVDGFYDGVEFRGEDAIAFPTFPELNVTVAQIFNV
ncbi:Uma2 family endonuclease [Planktothrix serta]|nr:Uma2 family endonuclease [Planktothrix serta]